MWLAFYMQGRPLMQTLELSCVARSKECAVRARPQKNNAAHVIPKNNVCKYTACCEYKLGHGGAYACVCSLCFCYVRGWRGRGRRSSTCKVARLARSACLQYSCRSLVSAWGAVNNPQSGEAVTLLPMRRIARARTADHEHRGWCGDEGANRLPPLLPPLPPVVVGVRVQLASSFPIVRFGYARARCRCHTAPLTVHAQAARRVRV